MHLAVFFKAVGRYSSEVSEMDCLSFITGRNGLSTNDGATINKTQHQNCASGQCVNMEYEQKTYHGLVLDVKENQYKISCFKLDRFGRSYIFESGIQFGIPRIIKSHMMKEPRLVNTRAIYMVKTNHQSVVKSCHG